MASLFHLFGFHCSGYDGRQSDANMLINLDNYLPLGTKKAAKCYVLARHPLQPQILAVGSNTGGSGTAEYVARKSN